MHVNITPETARIVSEELRNGHFSSIDDLIMSGVQAWHERNSLGENIPTSSSGGERARKFLEWAKSHPATPLLSNESISRASLNPDRW